MSDESSLLNMRIPLKRNHAAQQSGFHGADGNRALDKRQRIENPEGRRKHDNSSLSFEAVDQNVASSHGSGPGKALPILKMKSEII